MLGDRQLQVIGLRVGRVPRGRRLRGRRAAAARLTGPAVGSSAVLGFERQVVDALSTATDPEARTAVAEWVDGSLAAMPELLRAGVALGSVVLGAWASRDRHRGPAPGAQCARARARCRPCGCTCASCARWCCSATSSCRPGARP